jgi:HK97 gp10 family phage protein
VTGVDQTLAAFASVKSSLQKKYLRKAQADNARLVLWAVRGRTPKRRGLLYKSLGRKVKVYRGRNIVVAVVGARTGFRQQVGTRKDGTPIFANPVKYLHLVELGTARSRGHGMIRAALTSTKAQVAANLRQAMESAIADANQPRGGAA